MMIQVTINGTRRELEVQPGERVRDLLRRENILSVRNGCDGQGSCGACTILLDGRTVNSCQLLAPQVDGKKILTVEHMAKNRELSPIQTAFVDAGVVQCGYCTPAMLLATKDLLARHPHPTREQMRDAFSAVFCRCTGYEQFFSAVDLAAQRLKDPAHAADRGPEFRDDLRLVGKSGKKVDAPRLVRGEKAFVEDMISADTCHLKVLGSPHAHAYIKHIDVRRAEALPGVVLVITHENCPDVYYNQAGQGFPEPSPYDRKMFGRKLRHVGDRVAAVVAETPEIAEEALRRIKVQYEVLKPVLSIDDAAAPNAPLIHNSVLEYVTGEPAGLDNSKADPRDGRIIYQFPIHADPRRNIAASVSGGIGDVARGLLRGRCRPGAGVLDLAGPVHSPRTARRLHPDGRRPAGDSRLDAGAVAPSPDRLADPGDQREPGARDQGARGRRVRREAGHRARRAGGFRDVDDRTAGSLSLHARRGVHRLAHPPPDEDQGQAGRQARRQPDRDRDGGPGQHRSLRRACPDGADERVLQEPAAPPRARTCTST